MTGSSGDHLYFQILPSIVGFLVMMTLTLIALARGGKKRTHLLFAGIVFLGALINLDVALISLIKDKALALALDRATYLLFIFSPAVYIGFVHSFLGLENRRLLEKAVLAVCFLLLFFVPTGYFITGLKVYEYGVIAQAGPVFHVFSLLVAFAVFYSLFILRRSLGQAKDNLSKNRIKYILVGMGFSALLIALNILPVSGIDIYPPSSFSFLPALFLGVGFLKYDLIDIGFVVRQGAAYLLLSTVLAAVYVALVMGANFIFWGLTPRENWVLPFIFAFLVAVFFGPMKDGAQKFIDRLFYRRTCDYGELLEQISFRLAAVRSLGEIDRLLVESLRQAFQVGQVSLLQIPPLILAREGEKGEGAEKKILCRDEAIIALAAGRKPFSRVQWVTLDLPSKIRADLVDFFCGGVFSLWAPVVMNDRCLGFIALGEKLSGELFLPEDLSFLATLANQTAVAIENSKGYEALQELNLRLEHLVTERTAELTRALAEKERVQSRMIRSESLAAVGRLAAGVAHELNNPLAAGISLVQTSVDSIKKGDLAGGAAADDISDDLEFAIKELRRAALIVRSLLDVSRQGNDYREEVKVNLVAEDSLRVLSNLFKKQEVRLIKDLDEEDPSVTGNYAQLSQVMINLIKNALQALPAGGGIITLSSRQEGDRVAIEVADNGRGMSPEELREIFTPFYTTKPVGEGIGLGLYLVSTIVDRHGGEIVVTSEQGAGSRFKVILPTKREGK